MGRILSIDYGRKRIGLAMSDEDEFLAFTLSHITSGSQDKLFGQLIAKIKKCLQKNF